MPQAFSVEDLYLHRKITEIDCTEQGDFIACAVRSVDRAKDTYLSSIWGYAPDGNSARQLTHGPGKDNTPRWSPDGSQLAFVSDRSGTVQVYLLPRAGGEATQLGRFDGAVSDIKWWPDGKSLLVTVSVDVDPDWRGERANGRKPRERGPRAPEVAWRLPYKNDGSGYKLAREIHLFRLDASTGETEQLTDGPFDVMAASVAPNGKHVAFVRTREGRFAHRTDLWVCDADGSGARQLTREQAMVMEPTWSPDGRWIAFSGSTREGDAWASMWLLEFPTAKLRRLGDESLEVADPLSLRWDAKSSAIVFARACRGHHQVARIEIASDTLSELLDVGVQFGAFAQCGEQFAWAGDHPTQPSELHLCRGGGKPRQLSDLNAWWKDRAQVSVESREFRVPDGEGGIETIHGWLLRPEGAQGPMPLLNDVHGGPASYALLDYDTNVYWQVLCSQGWAVLLLNAVGSASYSREFCDRLMGHWGEYDLPQHIEAVRQLKREGVCDDRVAIAGKSYGGYLTGWAIGNCGMFRGAVVMAPVGNIETHYGTSDGGYYADPLYMGSGSRFDRGLARKLSPMEHIERARTPTLFLQGKEDERCPKCQSEELFVSLSCAQETPAEMVLYPGEGHLFLSEGVPSVRADAAQRIIDWVVKYISQPAPEPAESARTQTERA